jgi:hypothetical protein
LTATTLSGGSDIENDNYTMAAYDITNGKLGIVYCTEAQTVTLNLSRMSEPVTVRWYDPTTGNYTNISGSSFSNIALHQFTTPSIVHNEINTDNSAETSNDWVLVVEVASAVSKK